MEKYKIIIIGPPNSGKSTILNQIKNETIFGNKYTPTIGVDFASKIITDDSLQVKIHIWDTAGQERFDSIVSAYYKDANMALIVIDLSEKYYNHTVTIDDWIGRIDNFSGDIPIILIGNKIDKIKDNNKLKLDIENFDKISKYFEISANNINDVNNILEYLIKNEILNFVRTKVNTKKNSIIIEPKKKSNFMRYLCPFL